MKFVILAPPRSGSTLLCRALRNHPNIECAGERFLDLYGKEPKDFQKYASENSLHGFILEDGLVDYTLYLKSIFMKFNGFKIIHSQVKPSSYIFKELDKIDDLKVLYLRRHLLESFISFHYSKQVNCRGNQTWHILPHKELPVDVPHEFNTVEISQYFKTVDVENALRRTLKNRPSLTVNYYDLANDWERTVLEIQEFLEVYPMKLPITLKKRTRKSPCQLMNNYSEISKFFWRTKYADLFDLKKMFL